MGRFSDALKNNEIINYLEKIEYKQGNGAQSRYGYMKVYHKGKYRMHITFDLIDKMVWVYEKSECNETLRDSNFLIPNYALENINAFAEWCDWVLDSFLKEYE